MSDWKKNDKIQVLIEDLSESGEGVGKTDGFTWFIKDTVIGDLVEAKVMKVKKSYGFARLEQIIKPSEGRITPMCPVARQCGGCQLQAMNYEEQLRYKENKIKNHIIRIGGFKEIPMLPIMGMDEPLRYRNKAQFPWGLDKEGRPIAGFYAGRTHDIIGCEDCLLGVSENQEVLKRIKAHMERYHLAPYDEHSQKGLIRHTLIRKGFQTGELMVCQVINGNKLPHSEELVKSLLEIPGMTSISLNVNKETNQCDPWKPGGKPLWPGIHHRLHRYGEIPDLSAILFPGKPGADAKAIWDCLGICRTYWWRDRLGFILWNRNHLAVSGPEGEEGLRGRDRSSGN